MYLRVTRTRTGSERDEPPRGPDGSQALGLSAVERLETVSVFLWIYSDGPQVRCRIGDSTEPLSCPFAHTLR